MGRSAHFRAPSWDEVRVSESGTESKLNQHHSLRCDVSECVTLPGRHFRHLVFGQVVTVRPGFVASSETVALPAGELQEVHLVVAAFRLRTHKTHTHHCVPIDQSARTGCFFFFFLPSTFSEILPTLPIPRFTSHCSFMCSLQNAVPWWLTGSDREPSCVRPSPPR